MAITWRIVGRAGSERRGLGGNRKFDGTQVSTHTCAENERVVEFQSEMLRRQSGWLLAIRPGLLTMETTGDV